MKVFVVRNLFSIMSAEIIIERYKIKDYIFLIPTDDKNYFLKLKNNITYRNSKIYNYKNINYPPIKKIFKSKIIDENHRKITIFLNKIKCSDIFISNLDDFFERQLLFIAKQKKIKINLYEEGTNIYFENTIKNFFKCKVKNILSNIVAPKYKFYFISNKFKIEVDNVFCFLKKAYKFKNYQKLIQLDNLIDFSNKERLKIEFLLATRPLSEDSLLEEEEELSMIVDYIKKNNVKKIYLKPHPRENELKIEKLLNILKKLEIEVELSKEKIPLEKMVEKYEIQKILGYETGSLVYLSELYGIECDSLLKIVVEKTNSDYFKNYYSFYKQNFKKINYV